MIEFKAEDLARWSRGTWVPHPPARIEGISHDTRTISHHALYVALRGEKFDGHEFLATAFERGASAAMVQRGTQFPATSDKPLLLVDEPAAALQAIAAGHRRTIAAEIIAVTGSVGKTTMKDLAAAMLGAALPTSATKGNWNNAIGVPLSLLDMRRSDAVGVFEVGMNHPGEIAPLCQIILPTWGVVTSIGPVHMEFFNSVEDIALEKAELLRSLPSTGTAILDSGCTCFDLLRAAIPCRLITVSLTREADYYCVARSPEGKGMQAAVIERATGQRHVVQIPLPGDHHVVNTLLALAVARGLGVEWRAIAEALRGFTPSPMRWQVVRVGSVDFINDAYNANPLSMRAALQAFRSAVVRGRRWLVLGGMLELGRIATHAHRQLGRLAGSLPWGGIVTVGDLGRLIAEGATEAGFASNRLFAAATPREAGALLAERCGAGDAVLLKASRGIRLEEVLEYYNAKVRASA